MARMILGGNIAKLPYEAEELDLRLYTSEELCYYIFHFLPLLGDDFIDDRLMGFIEGGLGLTETAEKIRRFYHSPSDQDATLQMILSDLGYYQDKELTEFQNRLVKRRRKNSPERKLEKADTLFALRRYSKAVRIYRTLANDTDGRITRELRTRAMEGCANSYGRLSCYQDALRWLRRAYKETGELRILKKMYGLSVLSGMELGDFDQVPEKEFQKWHEEYSAMENAARARVQEDELMQSFFKDKSEREKLLRQYAAREKEIYRVMYE
ncbi:MAG: hypothetical protein J6Y95_00770 [Lachnospiraceae bacterium]|nr:hypothetical protein [Lachnospiraceae bacterium]